MTVQEITILRAAWSALYDWDALDVVVNGDSVRLGFDIERVMGEKI